MSNVVALTTANFQQEVASGYTLIDFWAEWCTPCKMVAPIIEALSTEISDKVKIANLDTDANSDIAMQYGVQSIPTLILFKDGQEVDRVVGAMPKEAIVSFLTDRGALTAAPAQTAA